MNIPLKNISHACKVLHESKYPAGSDKSLSGIDFLRVAIDVLNNMDETTLEHKTPIQLLDIAAKSIID